MKNYKILRVFKFNFFVLAKHLILYYKNRNYKEKNGSGNSPCHLCLSSARFPPFSHRETTVLRFLSIIPGFLYYCLITKMDSDFPLFYATGSTFFKNNFYLYCGKIYITMTVETTLSF